MVRTDDALAFVANKLSLTSLLTGQSRSRGPRSTRHDIPSDDVTQAPTALCVVLSSIHHHLVARLHQISEPQSCLGLSRCPSL